MKLKLLIPLLFVLSGIPFIAGAGESFSNFDHLIPLVRDAGMDPAKVYLGRAVSLDSRYYAIPLSGEQEEPSRGALVVILDKRTNTLHMSLGTVSVKCMRINIEHGDSQHLVFSEMGQFESENQRWAAYFDLERKQVIELKEIQRFGMSFLARTSRGIIRSWGKIKLPSVCGV